VSSTTSLPIVSSFAAALGAAGAHEPEGDPFLVALLKDQQDLTAIEQLARDIERTAGARLDDAGPAQARYYRRLLPAAPPGPGQQYAFDVDLDRCSGCKACVTACHALNGLDTNETWRDVGLLVGGTSHAPVMQHVTTACHHCLEPGCMIACPVNAYEKDPLTGIVKHLDDQCFGCQYCTLACPYDVPKYHARLGIVRKCDMCSHRLSVGEAPACVQACPHEAIRIQVVDCQEVVESAEAANFLPAAPDAQITLPTTTYRSTRVFPRNTLPADYYSVNPQHPHWPLVLMLVLTQLSVGAFVVGLVLEALLPPADWSVLRPIHATSAVLFGLAALGASVFHLGRPFYAYRAMLGLRHSWLSREILAFGLFAGMACTYCGATLLIPDAAGGLLNVLAWLVAVAGVAGVFCSVMIYAFTQREFWSFWRTTSRFGLTMAVLGTAATGLSIIGLAVLRDPGALSLFAAKIGPLTLQSLAAFMTLKLAWEAALFRHLASRRTTELKRSALLASRQLSHVTMARFAAGLLGGIIMPLFLLYGTGEAPSDTVQLLLSLTVIVVACTAGELLERYLFFAAASSQRMPGGIRT